MKSEALNNMPVAINPRLGLGPTHEDIAKWYTKYHATVRAALQSQAVPSAGEVAKVRGILTHISGLRKQADEMIGLVDHPHHKALNMAVEKSLEALATLDAWGK